MIVLKQMRISIWVIISILAVFTSFSSLSGTTTKEDSISRQPAVDIRSDSLFKKNQQLAKANVVSGDKVNSQISKDLRVNKSLEEEKRTGSTPKRILALFAFKQALPWSYRIEETLRTTLTTNPPFPIEFNVEHADLPRNPDKVYTQKLLDFYKHKYSSKKLDLILALGDESAALIAEYGEELFGSTPVVLVTSEKGILPPSFLKKNIKSFVWGWDCGATIGLIGNLLPKVKNLYLISGNSHTDLGIRENALKSVHLYEKRFDIKFITDFVTSEMLEKVGQLPEDSAIFFLSVLRDMNNEYFVSRDLMHVVSSKANVPTFGLGDTYLGHGIVGGSLLSAEVQGKRFADISVKLLTGVPLSEKDMTSSNLFMFDWRELRRWSISEKKLPPDSIVRYREPSVWKEHIQAIIIGFTIISFQAVALILLLIQRRKRSEAEAESHRLRDEIAQVSRVLTMGEIAASLAHELNQPLTAIQSYAQAARRFLSGSPPDLKEVDTSLNGVVIGSRRAKDVIQRIRKNLEKQPSERRPVRVRDLVDEAVLLVSRTVDEKNIVLRIEIPVQIPMVFGDRVQIQQVLLNLIINGCEAIDSANGGIKDLVVKAVANQPGFVTISVQDSGIGTEEENLENIFDAFFTTKREGLGLGLAISRSIVEEHGGRLWASQNQAGGTTFSITVPEYEENR
ncbi:MAG: ATP-binding protein [Desulforhopalus sp.]